MAEAWRVDAPGISVTRYDGVPAHMLRLGRTDKATLERFGAAAGTELPPPNRTNGFAPRALWLAPGEYLLLGKLPDSLAVLTDAELAHLADMTDALARYRLDGENCRELLSKGCTLDLHPHRFGPGSCAQSVLAQVSALIEHEPAGVLSITIEASYAHHLERWFEDACIEFRAGSA